VSGESYHYKLPLVLKIEIDRSVRALGSGFTGGGSFRTDDFKPDVAETDRSRPTQQYSEENARRVGGYVENNVVILPICRSEQRTVLGSLIDSHPQGRSTFDTFSFGKST